MKSNPVMGQGARYLPYKGYNLHRLRLLQSWKQPGFASAWMGKGGPWTTSLLNGSGAQLSMKISISNSTKLYRHWTKEWRSTLAFTIINGLTKASMIGHQLLFMGQMLGKTPSIVENGDNCKLPQLPPFSTTPTTGPRTCSRVTV